jgi:hypothetical protein
MIFSGPDSKSTWKMGLSTSRTKQNDTGHSTVILATIIDLAISEVIFYISLFKFTFSLKNESRPNLNHLNLTTWSELPPIIILGIVYTVSWMKQFYGLIYNFKNK